MTALTAFAAFPVLAAFLVALSRVERRIEHLEHPPVDTEQPPRMRAPR